MQLNEPIKCDSERSGVFLSSRFIIVTVTYHLCNPDKTRPLLSRTSLCWKHSQVKACFFIYFLPDELLSGFSLSGAALEALEGA